MCQNRLHFIDNAICCQCTLSNCKWLLSSSIKNNDVCIRSHEHPVTPTNGVRYNPSSTNHVTLERAEAKPGNESAMTNSERTEDLSTPESKSTSDMAVGTTPLRTPTVVLMNVFPQLAKRPKLLQMISDQVSLAAQEDPRGWRYDKAIISLALTLWTRSPHNLDELLNTGFIFPSPTTISLYKNCVSKIWSCWRYVPVDVYGSLVE